MLLDDVDDPVIEPIFEGEVHAFFDVRNNNERAHRGSEVVVWIPLEVHVFGEVFRLHQFAYVMKLRADAAEGRIRADGFRRGLCEIGYNQAVVIRARCLDGHSAQQRVIKI